MNKVLDDNSIEKWCSSTPFLLNFSKFWARYMPRGKGWVPRITGRLFCKKMKACIRTSSGLIMAIDPKNLDIYCNIWASGGTWERHVLNTCLGALKKRDVFYDIGANAGIFTLEAANLLKNSIQVHSFEPQESLVNTLRTSLLLNKFNNVTTHKFLLSDKSRKNTLYIPKRGHSIHASTVARDESTIEKQYESFTIDNLVKDKVIPAPNVVKMDVEGSELSVLKGAKKTIQRHKPVIVFEADENMKRFGYNHREIFDLLLSLADYIFYFIRDEANIELINNETKKPFGNYVAIPKLSNRLKKIVNY